MGRGRGGQPYCDRERPWELNADDPHLHDVLATVVHAYRTVASEICPFLPDAAARLRQRLTAPTSVAVGRCSPASPHARDPKLLAAAGDE